MKYYLFSTRGETETLVTVQPIRVNGRVPFDETRLIIPSDLTDLGLGPNQVLILKVYGIHIHSIEACGGSLGIGFGLVHPLHLSTHCGRGVGFAVQIPSVLLLLRYILIDTS